MTLEEFQLLQVGDVVRRGCETWVVFDCNDEDRWVVKQLDGENRPLRFDDRDIDMWTVVSKVLSRMKPEDEGERDNS